MLKAASGSLSHPHNPNDGTLPKEPNFAIHLRFCRRPDAMDRPGIQTRHIGLQYLLSLQAQLCFQQPKEPLPLQHCHLPKLYCPDPVKTGWLFHLPGQLAQEIYAQELNCRERQKHNVH